MREPNLAGKADTNTNTIHTSGDDERCTRLVDEKHAEGTRQTYRRAVRGFDEWLDGRTATDAELARHLGHMFSRGMSPNYAGVVVAAVEDRAEREGSASPCAELTARSLVGFRRNGAGRGTGQVAGIGWKDAKRVAKLAEARGDLAGLRDALYIRIASACLLRVSEASALDVGNLSFAKDGGLLVHVRRSKTDQQGKGSTHYAGTPAATLLRRWLKAADIDAGPLFRRIHRSGAVRDGRLGARTFRDIVKRRAAAAGIGGRVSGHSFRIGAAQSMRAAGATHAEIMVEGRWKRIETMLRYIRDQDAATGTTARLCFGVTPPDGRSKRRGGHEAAERARRQKRGGKAAKELRRIRKDSRRIMSTLAKQGKQLARIEKAL
ncbi:MAG: site-specific integrase [Gammaproteobacteria bacterium]|nr:site-specific integrase [Gammaproteobacteria bacterium]